MNETGLKSFRDIIAHAIGGGWGDDEPTGESQPVLVIRGADFPEVALQRSGSLPLRHETKKRVSSRSLEPGDIVLEISGGTRDRPTGRTVYVTDDLLSKSDYAVIPASFCRLVRIDGDQADSRFVYYFLQDLYNSGGTWEYQNQSTGISNFQFELFCKKFSFLAMPIPEQRAVAAVLGALDDKISANLKLVEAADALASATFDRMLDDAESIPLTEVAQFVNGKAFTKGATGTGRVIIRIAELNSGIGGSTVYNDIDVIDQHVARPGDLLFAWSGSLTLHRWFRPEAIVNQHIFKVIPSNGYPIWCSYGLIARKLDEFKGIAADKATTMGHIQRRHLEEPVDVPARSTIERCDSLMTTLWNSALLAEQESLTLTSIRDALLPQLMSGKIRVRGAEKKVEGVL